MKNSNLRIPPIEIDDRRKWLKLIEQKHNEGNIEATYILATIYLYGYGLVLIDLNTAYKLFLQCDEANYAESWVHISLFYSQGWVVGKDMVKAKEYCDKALSAGQDWGKLFAAFSVKHAFTANELNQSFEHLTVAYEKTKDPILAYRIGFCHYNGLGTKINSDKAEDFFKHGLELQHAFSVNNLGACYYTKQDFENALVMYKQAADQNHPHALYNLAKKYLLGQGVKVNEDIAYDYLRKAAAIGDEASIVLINSNPEISIKLKNNYRWQVAKVLYAGYLQDEGCNLSRLPRDILGIIIRLALGYLSQMNLKMYEIKLLPSS